MAATTLPTDSLHGSAYQNLSENGRAALRIAARGWSVHPLCHPTADGSCSARHVSCRDNPRSIGKTPITMHGDGDATTDTATIIRWWSTWAEANVGVALEPAGLLMTDPDSPAALAEATANGLPPTTCRASHNPAYLYKRPDGCPATSVTHRGTSGAIDVKTNGYAVVFGRHRLGEDIYLEPCDGGEPAEAPAWAVALLSERPARPRPTTTAIDDDEPPVRLAGNALRRWTGELAVTTPDGDLDRSRALFHIGLDLAEAGMTRRGIVAALVERDDRLGWRKYADRRDGDDQYAAIADKVLTEYEASEAAPSIGNSVPTGACPGCCDCCARPDNDTTHALAAQIHRNDGATGLRGAATVALAVVNEYQRAADLGRADADGWTPLPLSVLGKTAGRCAKTAGRHLERLAAAGILETAQRSTEGQPPGETTTFVRLVKPTDETLRVLATATLPATSELVKYRRKACCARPDLYRETKVICRTCGIVVDDRTERGAPWIELESDLDGSTVPNNPPRPALRLGIGNSVPTAARGQPVALGNEYHETGCPDPPTPADPASDPQPGGDTLSAVGTLFPMDDDRPSDSPPARPGYVETPDGELLYYQSPPPEPPPGPLFAAGGAA